MAGPATEPRGIFVSYRREHAAAQAGRLYDWLAAHFGEEHVFMDVDSIRFGVDFVQVIEDAVTSCDAVLMLIGADWANAPNDRATGGSTTRRTSCVSRSPLRSAARSRSSRSS
jgi:hypothetical protein